MTLVDPVRETTLSVLYQQDPDALARVLSVLRRLRIHIEALSAIPAGNGTARAVLLIQCPTYHAERARALIARLVPVLDVVELGTSDPRSSRDGAEVDKPDDGTEKGLDDGYDSV
jgi:acetolactate synthase small subunit